ncbi:MAG: MoxR family ATPase [Clostridia bacterium]|nr:MoxR family ATPase [Clostridia bacterium]
MIQPRRMISALLENVSRVIVGKEEAIEYVLIAMLCQGHVLIEDVPGVGKTTLASALARSLDCSFRRIQFTPDLMPSDVTGYTLVNMTTGVEEFREGSVMSQVVLADEINRTSPKTQAALLEAMEEHQVTVDGVTHSLPRPFIVLATQNPNAFVGTYPLPEAQMDRFFLRIGIGYPTVVQEMDVLERYTGQVKPMEQLQPVCSAGDVIAMQEAVNTVYCSPEVRSYVANLAAATRNAPALQLGLSTRAAIALLRGGQACALLSGRDYVIPEDIQHMVMPVCCHRLVLNPEAKMKGVTAESVMAAVLKGVQVPVRL